MRAARSRCELARNTLSNALLQRSLEQVIEAWAMFLAHYRPQIARMGKNFARIAAVDWATYCKQAGAAKITCIFDWVQGASQQFVFTASGKIHDLKTTSSIEVTI